MGEAIGIIEAEITGLATTYVLSSKYKVTIVARDLPGGLGRLLAGRCARKTQGLGLPHHLPHGNGHLEGSLILR